MAVANKIRKVNSTGSEARAYGGPQVAGIEYDVATDAVIIAPDSPVAVSPQRRAIGTVPVGTGTPVGLLKFTAAVNPAQVNANTTAGQVLAVPGVKDGDVLVAVEKPTATAGLGIVGGFVSDDDEVTVVFVNATASPIDPAGETYTFIVARV